MRARRAQIASGQAVGTIVTGAGRLYSVVCYETGGVNDAAFTMTDGDSADNQVLVSYTLLANESARDYWPGGGLPFSTSINLASVTGTVEAVVYYFAETDFQAYELAVIQAATSS